MPRPRPQTSTIGGDQNPIIAGPGGPEDLDVRDEAQVVDKSQVGKIARGMAASRNASTTTNESAEGGDPTQMGPSARSAYFRKVKKQQTVGGTPMTATAEQAALALGKGR